ncbi:EpsG family protein [Flavobacterium restrictum]|uniref:EpsG family protein n=1 Tax=Flavobacterium restrictum TaxID=2594428 RepID=A0A553E512_9FLAO|nr:EpsG family protein [Flavobacterium restrictum]TRX40134.1 EpsG family protein [Flavobacterium restrictum]
MLAVAIFFQFYFSFIFQFIAEIKWYKKTIFFLSLFAFYILFIGITDTADWRMYDDLFNIDDIETDILFRYFSLVVFALGYSFTDLFQVHILLYGFLLVQFISRFTQNILLVLGFYVFIAYVPLANQIRYYLALSLFLNGLYFFYFDQKRKSYYYLALSFLSHSSMIVLFGFFVLEKQVAMANFVKTCLLLSVVIFFGFNFVVTFGLLDFLGKFKEYIINDDLVSSFIGGVFNELPFILTLIVIYFWIQNVLVQLPQLLDNKVFVFLYKLTFFSIIFIPISFNIQVLGHRYVQAFFIVWLCLFVYVWSFIKSRDTNIFYFSILSVYMIFLVYYIYFLPQIVLGTQSEYLVEFIKSYNSIGYLPDL